MITAFVNQKGGVGKTSSTFHLSGALAEAGARVLVVDCDPQASLTQAFYGPTATLSLDPAETILSVFGGARPSAESLIRRTAFDGVDLIPGSLRLAEENTPIHGIGSPFPSTCTGLKELAKCLESAAGYLTILIDCPPNIARCTASALLAADQVVIPVQPEDFGAQGIMAVEAAIGWARALTNPGLGLAGFLVTMHDARTALHRHYVQELRLAKGAAIFESIMPRSIDFPEAVMRRRPITLDKPKSKAAESMRLIASEYFRRTMPGLAGVGAADRGPALNLVCDAKGA